MVHYFDTYSTLTKTPNIGQWCEGDKALIEDSKEMYIYEEDKWIKPTDGLKITQYELNRQIFAKYPVLSEEEINKITEAINQWTIANSNAFYMLLNHDLHYFTMFRINGLGQRPIGEEVIDCALNLGEIIAYSDESENKVIEIWVRNSNGAVYCLVFFPYDAGVINCL